MLRRWQRAVVPCLLLATAGHTDPTTVAQSLSKAKAVDGSYISWREHIIDDPSRGTADLSGSDGPYRWTLGTLAAGPEAVAANKGEQNPGLDTQVRQNISLYLPPVDPLNGMSWREQLLGRVVIPINSEPVDLDGDGDLDVVGGSRGEGRILWFENHGNFRFNNHPIKIDRSSVATDRPITITGFNMDYADLDGDGRKDIVANAWPSSLVWLRQPESAEQPWPLTLLGTLNPDQLVSVRLGDIDGDGDLDVIGTRGNSEPYDGVIWLEQRRTKDPQPSFQQARREDSQQMPLP